MSKVAQLRNLCGHWGGAGRQEPGLLGLRYRLSYVNVGERGWRMNFPYILKKSKRAIESLKIIQP